MKNCCYLILLSLLAVPASALELPGQVRILPVDQAFRLTSYWQNDRVLVRWQMPPGYYLYRHAFALSSTDGDELVFRLPAGQPARDEHFGDVEIYFDDLTLEAGVADVDGVLIRYQGCADAGYCYPPQQRRLSAEESLY